MISIISSKPRRHRRRRRRRCRLYFFPPFFSPWVILFAIDRFLATTTTARRPLRDEKTREIGAEKIYTFMYI